MKKPIEEMFLIEELEARLEMTAVTLDDGSVVDVSDSDYAEAAACCHGGKVTVTVTCS